MGQIDLLFRVSLLLLFHSQSFTRREEKNASEQNEEYKKGLNISTLLDYFVRTLDSTTLIRRAYRRQRLQLLGVYLTIKYSL